MYVYHDRRIINRFVGVRLLLAPADNQGLFSADSLGAPTMHIFDLFRIDCFPRHAFIAALGKVSGISVVSLKILTCRNKLTKREQRLLVSLLEGAMDCLDCFWCSDIDTQSDVAESVKMLKVSNSS